VSLTYSTYLTALEKLTNIPASNESFAAIVPNAIDYAEGRIWRELDLLAADVVDGSASLTPGSRNFTIPTAGVGKFQVVSRVNVITPASTAPDAGTRRPLEPVSADVLDLIYPSNVGAGVPSMFAYVSQSLVSAQASIIVGPWPDAAYRVEVAGKVQPTSLSEGNPTTFISTYLPDLFLAASMVFMTGYMKNWGAQADDPRSGLSWESQYTTLRDSAGTFEARKRFAGASWTPKQPEPTAQPQRG
jgi:hypothetical protein